MYKAGYDEVRITFDNEQELEGIERSLSLEAGSYEIVQQGKNQCTVRSISEASESEFDNILRRTLLLLKTMGEGILEALKKGDIETIKNLRTLEKTNNKLTHYLRRALNKQGYKERRKITTLYTIVEGLEKVADQYEYLCNFLSDPSNKNLKISKEGFVIFKKVNDSVALYCELFYKYDKDKAVTFAKLRKEVVSECKLMFNKKPSKEYSLIHYLLTIEQTIFDLFGPYLAMTL